MRQELQPYGHSRRVANKTRKVVPWITCLHTDSQPMSVAYLEKLNPEQRRAVEHGVRENDAAPGTPLLVIAGAGSGKRIANSARVPEIARQEADRGDPLARGLDQPQLRLPNKIIS